MTTSSILVLEKFLTDQNSEVIATGPPTTLLPYTDEAEAQILIVSPRS